MAKTQTQSDREAAEALNATPDADLGEGNGQSIEDLVDDDADQPELFPMGTLEGEGITPQRLIKKGLPVEVTVSIGKAEVPMPSGGLMDPNKSGRALVSYVFGKNEDIPQFEDGNIVGWKIRQNLRATYVQNANDEAELIRREFEALMALDGEAAGRVLDELKTLFSEG